MSKLTERQRKKYKEAAAERYARLKANGVCTGCGKERARTGRVLCKACQKKRSSDAAKRARRLGIEGLCGGCGLRPREEKVVRATGEKRLLVLCSVCNAKRRKCKSRVNEK